MSEKALDMILSHLEKIDKKQDKFDEKLDAVYLQTKLTNGRVTKAEENIKSLQENLSKMNSKIHNLEVSSHSQSECQNSSGISDLKKDFKDISKETRDILWRFAFWILGGIAGITAVATIIIKYLF